MESMKDEVSKMRPRISSVKTKITIIILLIQKGVRQFAMPKGRFARFIRSHVSKTIMKSNH
jgi:hypothetical protein